MLIDTHCHLNSSQYQNDLDEVIKRATGNGVTKIICASSNLFDSIRAIEIAKKYPGIVYASIGIHPQQTDPDNYDSVSDQLAQLDKLVLSVYPESNRGKVEGSKGVIAIGECGLDYSPALPPEKNRTKDEQKKLFIGQIKLAQKYGLPLIIHSRKSFDDVVSIIHDQSSIIRLRGVFHCYTGGKKGIEKVNKLGFYFGLDGNLTYDEGLQNVAKFMPREKIILETDSPYLTPVPWRGNRNEPKNIKLINEFFAQMIGAAPEETARLISQNAQLLFNFDI